MAHILVIDDEPDLVRFVARALDADGHQVTTALDGAEGLQKAIGTSPDMVVLDLVMPGIEGRAVLSGLLAVRPDARVLVLSADAGVRARIEVLEAGAVDFLAKPFATRELIARVRCRLHQQANTEHDPQTLTVGGMSLDLRARRLRIDDRLVDLSQREFLLMQHLMRRSNQVCSREELLSEVWGYSFDPATNVVDVCVGRLRQKLRSNRIHTVRNVGYELQIG
ncbi:response regulator transcription factor [Nocardioides sp.]|uniref:response regulator transcription factor n=1 Tax=Nocardioides sp. TaxID=35761 RepID=UPI003D11DFB1